MLHDSFGWEHLLRYGVELNCFTCAYFASQPAAIARAVTRVIHNAARFIPARAAIQTSRRHAGTRGGWNWIESGGRKPFYLTIFVDEGFFFKF
jgi:hypothetical protein